MPRYLDIDFIGLVFFIIICAIFSVLLCLGLRVFGFPRDIFIKAFPNL
jgi:hypothetical protein